MSNDAVVIVNGARTPMGGFQGALGSVTATQLGAIAIREAVARADQLDDLAVKMLRPEMARRILAGQPGAPELLHVLEEELLPAALAGRVVSEVHRRIVGQDYMIERLLIGLLTGGHVLLEGVPGLGKTMLVRTLAGRARPGDLVRLGAFELESEGLLSLRDVYSREYDNVGVEPGPSTVTLFLLHPWLPSSPPSPPIP